jgi:hypothetical protein
MTDTPEDTPEVENTDEVKKPMPPLPPPPGEEPPPPVRQQAQAYEPEPGPPKSPPLAAFLSVLFPGIGHLYVWAYERAFMIWASIVVSVFMIIYGFWPFSFLIAFVYFFGIFDAFREAQFFNLKAEGSEAPKPKADTQGRLMFGVFLAVAAAVVLAEKLNILDMAWLQEWWPVPVLLLGLYFIAAAIRDRSKAKNQQEDLDSEY